jgi:hypothetical protein
VAFCDGPRLVLPLQCGHATPQGGFMKAELLKKLYTQLCDFGLNSKEWIIKPITKNKYLIHHHSDNEFQFMGQIDQQKWTQIWLVSV